MHIRVFQINPDRDIASGKLAMFCCLESMKKLGLQVQEEKYDLIYNGVLPDGNLEDVFCFLNRGIKPEKYYGRSMSVSDVVEMKGSTEIADGVYFCDSIGFQQISFDLKKTVDRVAVLDKASELIVKYFVSECKKTEECAREGVRNPSDIHLLQDHFSDDMESCAPKAIPIRIKLSLPIRAAVVEGYYPGEPVSTVTTSFSSDEDMLEALESLNYQAMYEWGCDLLRCQQRKKQL